MATELSPHASKRNKMLGLDLQRFNLAGRLAHTATLGVPAVALAVRRRQVPELALASCTLNGGQDEHCMAYTRAGIVKTVLVVPVSCSLHSEQLFIPKQAASVDQCRRHSTFVEMQVDDASSD